MSRPLAGLVHTTFGLATLEELPPRPSKACYRCHQDAWDAGQSAWVCRVCHPVPGSQPAPVGWKTWHPKVNPWEGVLELIVAGNKAGK